MKRTGLVVTALLTGWVCLANDGGQTDEMEFVRNVVQSLIASPQTMTFEVAEQVVAVDNGEIMSKEAFRNAWPEFRERAFRKKVSVDEFFAGVDLQIQPVADNERIMSNKRLLDVYKPQQGDMYCDASHVKEGVDNFIGYDKAFIYVIRKVAGKWTLIGIGG